MISLVVLALMGAQTTFTQNQAAAPKTGGVPVRLETALGNIDMDIVRKIQQQNPVQPAPRQQVPLVTPVAITKAFRIK